MSRAEISGVKMGWTEWALLGALSILWGGSFFFAKVAVAEIPPITLVLYRVGLAAVALAVYLRATGRRLPTAPKLWAVFLGLGLINNVLPFGLIFFAQQTIPSGLASILNATTPVFVMLVAHALTADEKLAGHKLVGVALGILGVAALMGPEAFDIDAESLAALGAMTASLGAALAYGFSSVASKRMSVFKLDFATLAFGQLAGATVTAALLAFLIDAGGSTDGLLDWALARSGEVVAAVIALALLATALAYVIFFRIVAAGGATNVSLVTLLIPPTAILLGAVFLGERLAWSHFLGMALIGAGLLAIDGRLRLRRAPV